MTDFEEGAIILIDKPYGWTSFDVVNKIRYSLRDITGIKKNKIGHAGTLDPLASGLLILLTGKLTKKIETFQGFEKEYTGTFSLGATTPCFDLEKDIDARFPTDHITDLMIREVAVKFTGSFLQTPPVFSAIKINGKRAYQYARKEQDVEIPAKMVTIREFEITRIALPEVDFRICCSKGTYIRSLARDFGLALTSGAHLIALRRTRIGDYIVEDAVAPEDWLSSLRDIA